MSATGVYLILCTIAKRHLSSVIVTEGSSRVGNNVKDSHLCKNLRLGFWISINLILAVLLEISLPKSRRLKFLMAWNSGKQLLEKSMSSLK
jgi:hypothetical protein